MNKLAVFGASGYGKVVVDIALQLGRLEEACVVVAGAIINAFAKVGRGCIVNTGATIATVKVQDGRDMASASSLPLGGVDLKEKP